MRKILLTGYSGFLGSIILDFLENNNYEVIKVGRNKKADIICDLSIKQIENVEVDIVIHAAGKAHIVPKNDVEKEDFFKVNYLGTKNLIAGLDTKKLKTIIFISTVAVYGRETGNLIDEKSDLHGATPYAKSKIMAESILSEFSEKNNINLVILRLPLITGKKPVGNLLKISKAIQKGYYFRIGDGNAKRSIISANDVANILPELFKFNGIYNLTDIHHPSIREIDEVFAIKFKKKIKVLPFIILKTISRIGDFISFFPLNSTKFEKLTKSLTFDNKKILSKLNYTPKNGLIDLL